MSARKRRNNESFKKYRANLKKEALAENRRKPKYLFFSTKTDVVQDGTKMMWDGTTIVVPLGRAKQVGSQSKPKYVKW